MTEKIRIIKNESVDWSIALGSKTLDLLSRLTKLDKEEKDNLLKEAHAILSKCNNPNNSIGSTTGIAVGYVQSGKTMSFTTLTALAADNGFRIVIYFAGIKVNLLEQTTKRLKKDLLTQEENSRIYKVFQSPTIDDNIHSQVKNALGLKISPTILITVLKHL